MKKGIDNFFIFSGFIFLFLCGGCSHRGGGITLAPLVTALRGPLGRLNESEGEVAQLLSYGLSTQEIAKAVKADGQSLAAGTYQLRVTEREASPPAPGQTPQYERWAEFLQGGQVKGREVVTIVPQSDIAQVAEDRPPRPGAYRAAT